MCIPHIIDSLNTDSGGEAIAPEQREHRWRRFFGIMPTDPGPSGDVNRGGATGKRNNIGDNKTAK
jgi:hypothetical protein